MPKIVVLLFSVVQLLGSLPAQADQTQGMQRLRVIEQELQRLDTDRKFLQEQLDIANNPDVVIMRPEYDVFVPISRESFEKSVLALQVLGTLTPERAVQLAAQRAAFKRAYQKALSQKLEQISIQRVNLVNEAERIHRQMDQAATTPPPPQTQSPSPSPSPVPTQTQVFDNPTVDGMPLDNCLKMATGCGKPVADEFCKRQGFTHATPDFALNRERKNVATKTLGGETCPPSFGCDYFIRIQCAK